MSPADETAATASDAGTARGGPLAHKINYLFETVRRPDGKSYSNEEVAEAITELGEATISGTYLWYLRRGDRDNPTKKHLEILARFFGVSPAYFFDDARRMPAPHVAPHQPAVLYATGLHTIGPRQSDAHPAGSRPGAAHPVGSLPGPTQHPGAAPGAGWLDDSGRWVADLLHGLSPRSLRAVADVICRVRELEGLPVPSPCRPPHASD